MIPLEGRIRKEIEQDGPIPFSRFMELALYEATRGYYRRPRDPFGKEGDFFTNSQLQPVFGRLLGQQIKRWRQELGNPPGFTVVEMGPGRGETLQEVRRSLPDVKCAGVDVAVGKLPSNFPGVVYANEFFDALPAHLVEKKGGEIHEIFVDVADNGFLWKVGSPSSPQLVDYIHRYAPDLADGQKIEVNLAALAELDRIARELTHGYLLTIDYGYLAAEIAGGRRLPDGSLMSYERHQAKEGVLESPGERDITAHVNFTAIEQHGEELGLASLGLKTQAQFLLEIGCEDEFEYALRGGSEAASRQLRMQLKSLLYGMGETFRVLVQRK